jgi:hypothetical protein
MGAHMQYGRRRRGERLKNGKDPSVKRAGRDGGPGVRRRRVLESIMKEGDGIEMITRQAKVSGRWWGRW